MSDWVFCNDLDKIVKEIAKKHINDKDTRLYYRWLVDSNVLVELKIKTRDIDITLDNIHFLRAVSIYPDDVKKTTEILKDFINTFKADNNVCKATANYTLDIQFNNIKYIKESKIQGFNWVEAKVFGNIYLILHEYKNFREGYCYLGTGGLEHLWKTIVKLDKEEIVKYLLDKDKFIDDIEKEAIIRRKLGGGVSG